MKQVDYTPSHMSSFSYYRDERLHNDHLALTPLIDRLRQYDAMRLDLEKKGGEIEDISAITAVLRDPVAVGLLPDSGCAPLTDPDRLRNLVSMVGCGSIFLDIRKQNRGLPVYCISRVNRDYWSEYSLVVEDLYLSPGFPFADSRFSRLMYMGHESNYLRMSQFRAAAIERYCGEVNDPNIYADDLLYDIGHHCLSAMWHEDQRPAVVAANNLGLPMLLQAIELLYLCLSADLCVLRSHITPFMTGFFRDLYPQLAVSAFLDELLERNGKDLNMLPQLATRLFTRLNRAFREFLETDVQWEGWCVQPSQTTLTLKLEQSPGKVWLGQLPIYKLLFANLYQFNLVSDKLRKDDSLLRASIKLEKQAESILEQINCFEFAVVNVAE